MVVGISGIIFTVGIAPLLFTIGKISDERAAFSRDNMERNAFRHIVSDLVQANSINHSSPVIVMKSEELARDKRDALVVWSNTSVSWGGAVSNIIYAVTDPDVLDIEGLPALRRWSVSFDITSDSDIKTILKDERSSVMIEGATGFSVQILRGDEWEDDYIGGVPQAVQIAFEYENGESHVYQSWLPSIGQ